MGTRSTRTSRARALGRSSVRLSLAALSLFGVYLILLRFPGWAFPYAIEAHGIRLASDRPIPAEEGLRVLDEVAARLRDAHIAPREPPFAIHICNSSWREVFFFQLSYGSGGVALTPFPVAFVRRSDVARDVLYRPTGEPTARPRTLAYFIAHEITHLHQTERLGTSRMLDLPAWVREGTADHVAKPDSFDFADAARRFLEDDASMDPARSGLYDRYQLLVEFRMRIERGSLRALLEHPEDPRRVEARLRAYLSRRAGR